MELSGYMGKKIKVDLKNGFYFQGICTDANDEILELIDMNGRTVTIKHELILYVREVSQ